MSKETDKIYVREVVHVIRESLNDEKILSCVEKGHEYGAGAHRFTMEESLPLRKRIKSDVVVRGVNGAGNFERITQTKELERMKRQFSVQDIKWYPKVKGQWFFKNNDYPNYFFQVLDMDGRLYFIINLDKPTVDDMPVLRVGEEELVLTV